MVMPSSCQKPQLKKNQKRTPQVIKVRRLRKKKPIPNKKKAVSVLIIYEILRSDP